MNGEPPAFDKLLAWLDPDRDIAGEKYRKIQTRLIKIFACHGCSDPEKLADDTFDRVMQKIDWLIENYVGDPLLYFCGVARYVIKEDIRTRNKATPPAPNGNEHGESDEAYECLEGCMDELPQSNRRLVLEYYEGEGNAKIANRRNLANELGITLRALRLRIFHLRIQLRKCMELCLAKTAAY